MGKPSHSPFLSQAHKSGHGGADTAVQGGQHAVSWQGTAEGKPSASTEAPLQVSSEGSGAEGGGVSGPSASLPLRVLLAGPLIPSTASGAGAGAGPEPSPQLPDAPDFVQEQR